MQQIGDQFAFMFFGLSEADYLNTVISYIIRGLTGRYANKLFDITFLCQMNLMLDM